ncbi:hypothetical protein [Viridibacillus arvi]|uniref:hypothetical protein n=1 Tax=Viridibacillus arvi TaxID=263475 RepID=UPI003D2CD580
MKVLQFIGTREKADFALYFANVLTSLDKRVLIVDTTSTAIYRHGYLHMEENETIAEIQKIEVLCGTKNWTDVEKALSKIGEKPTNYDCIIIDIDSTEGLLASWPIDDRYYLSSNHRLHITKDIALLNRLFDEMNSTTVKRIYFESPFTLRADYLDHLMNNRPEWHAFSHTVEYDDFEERLKLQMQHEQIIPLKQLSRSIRETIESIISLQFEIELDSVNKVTKTSLFSKFGFKKKQIEVDNYSDSNILSISKKSEEVTES